MASVIENKGEEIDNLWKGLDDFLRSCIFGRVYRNKQTEFPEDDEEFFREDTARQIDKFFLEGAAQTLENFIGWWKDQLPTNHWVGITGSWRTINQKVVDDVTEIVRYITSNGLGILTGGALGVDYIATETVLRENEDPKTYLRIVLPINRIDYIRHFRNSNLNSRINVSQMRAIAEQIIYINRNLPEIIFDASCFDENKFLELINEKYREDCYSFRNNLVGYGCDGLIPFLVNESNGVKDAIRSASSMRKPIFYSKKLEYSIKQDGEDVIRDYSKLEIPNLSEKNRN